jgi:hypothetical protein
VPPAWSPAGTTLMYSFDRGGRLLQQMQKKDGQIRHDDPAKVAVPRRKRSRI